MGLLDQIQASIPVENQILLVLGVAFVGFGLLLILRRGRTGDYYIKAKQISRNKIQKHISYLERKILELDKMINSKKIKEHNLELRFSAERKESIHRELNKIRNELTGLANKRDRLIQEKQAYSRAYREATF